MRLVTNERDRARLSSDQHAGYEDLIAVCKRFDRNVMAARKFVQDIAEGRLTMEQSISIVIQLLEAKYGTGRRRGEPMGKAESVEQMEEMLEDLDAEDEKLVKTVENIKERRAAIVQERRDIRKALGSLTKQKIPSNGSRASSAPPRQECPWPTCSSEIPTYGIGHTAHIGKHERESGMKLEDAIRIHEKATAGR